MITGDELYVFLFLSGIGVLSGFLAYMAAASGFTTDVWRAMREIFATLASWLRLNRASPSPLWSAQTLAEREHAVLPERPVQAWNHPATCLRCLEALEGSLEQQVAALDAKRAEVEATYAETVAELKRMKATIPAELNWRLIRDVNVIHSQRTRLVNKMHSDPADNRVTLADLDAYLDEFSEI